MRTRTKVRDILNGVWFIQAKLEKITDIMVVNKRAEFTRNTPQTFVNVKLCLYVNSFVSARTFEADHRKREVFQLAKIFVTFLSVQLNRIYHI